MTASDVLTCTRDSTAHVPPAERLAYWEAQCAATLVGLRCSSLSSTGLEVEKMGISLPGLGVADIRGEDHVVERNASLVHQIPKESLFACQIVQGRAYFIQREQCLLLEPGETVIYDTRIPYLFGFLTSMRQLLIDVPITVWRESVEAGRLGNLPLKISARAGAEAMLSETLRATVQRFLREPVRAEADKFSMQTQTLLSALMDVHVRGAGASRAGLSYLLTAKQFIAMRIAEPDLHPQTVADAVGISLRHLSRLFASDEDSVAQYIWNSRLAGAHRDLLDLKLQKTSVSEIAFRWGFSSLAHFSRAIRTRYGASPLALRATARR
ncbi:AraC-like DNA-binding protein [Pseudacidovorax sp. 1753]|uniref:helix-turn-helix domain-containing protein n=1 Tax=Pseudacidovorax sp. 1753 TaxID=3156419 RepID=UPI003390AFBF